MFTNNDAIRQAYNQPNNAGIIPPQMSMNMYPTSPVFMQTFLGRDVAVLTQRVTVELVLGYYWDTISKAVHGEGDVTPHMHTFNRYSLPAASVMAIYIKHLAKMLQENADVTVAQVEADYLDSVLDAMVGIRKDLNEENVSKFVAVSGIEVADFIGKLGDFNVTVSQLLTTHFRPENTNMYEVSTVELDAPYLAKRDQSLTAGGFLEELLNMFAKPREMPWYTEIVSTFPEILAYSAHQTYPPQQVIGTFLLKALNAYVGGDLEQDMSFSRGSTYQTMGAHDKPLSAAAYHRHAPVRMLGESETRDD